MMVPQVRAGEVLTLARRSVQVDLSREYAEIGIRSYGRGIFHKPTISGADLGEKRVYEIHDGDLVISNVFAWEGAVAVAGPAESGRIGSHRFMTWVPRPEIGDARYLYHYFISERGIEQLQRASPGSAGRNRTLAIRAFEDLVIPLPGIDEQRAIATRLDAQVFAARQVTSDERPRSIIKSLRQRLVNDTNEVSERTLGDVLRLERTRITPIVGATYRQIGIYSWGKGIIENHPTDGQDLSKITYYKFPVGALILSNIQAWEAAIAVSEERHVDFVASQRFLPYIPVRGDEVDIRYLKHYFLSDTGMALIQKASPGTVTRNRTLGIKMFEGLVIPLPNIREQRTIAARLDAVDRLSHLIQRRNNLAATLPQAARNEVFSKLV